MKKRLLYLLFASFLLATCSNEFDLTAPWKEVPVVYAILNPKDTAHYIRVEKAFLSPDQSALEIARIPDSLYYPENAIAVYLEKVNGAKRYQLTRVDGVKDGIVRKEGIFAEKPNWLYKITPNRLGGEGLVPGEKYRVIIKRADGNPDITSETTVPKNFIFNKPNPAQLPPFVSFSNNVPTTISWRADESALYFNVTFRIRYREETPAGVVIAKKELVWPAGKNVKRGETNVGGVYPVNLQIAPSVFFSYLVANLPAVTDRFRSFEGMELIVEGGGKDIERLLETQAANSGITGAELIPTYSNISEGYGLFLSKNVSSLDGVRLTPQTIDSMKLYPGVRELNFR